MKKRSCTMPRPKRGRPVNASREPPTSPTGASPNPNVGETSTSLLRHLSMPQHHRNLLEFLNEDRARQKFCDVSVSVGESVYRAHRVVLAYGSSYFNAELSKNPSTAAHVTLDHVEDSVFQHLLGFLYTAECTVAEKELPAVVRAAQFLDMMDVLKLLRLEAQIDTASVIHNKAETSEFTEAGAASETSQDNSAESAAGDERPLAQEVKTRKSNRSRKTPIKYKKVEIKSQNPQGQEGKSSTAVEKQMIGGNEETHGDDEGEDEDGGETNLGGASQNTEQASANQVVKQRGGKKPAAESLTYPEGLAPLIIQSATKRTLKCPKCDKTFDRAGKYESHTRVHTGEKPFQCDVCLQRYSTKSNLTVHKKKHSADAPVPKKDHKCPYCNKLHASKKTLGKHVRRFHPDNVQEFFTKKKKKSEGWKCTICFKIFSRRPHLQEHMILHTQDQPFKCTFCDEYFRSRFARLKHQEKFHLGPFPCEICGRQFNDSGNKKRHIECTHGGKRKWTCFVCGKSVRERTTLREHLRIHSGEKPHLCSICGQSFRHSSSYRLHLRVHHEDKRYECDECGKTFIRHDHLTKHQKIHSGEKAHQCEECGKCFRRHDHLTVHYKSVHLGEKIWQKYKTAVHQCEVCKKEFKGKSSLEMHFRTHSGEKPHRCPECHQTFRIKKTLTKHMVIHSDARPFNCPQCSATFKRKDKLKYHVDHVHSTRSTSEALNQDKVVPARFEESPKPNQTEAKAVLRSSSPPTNVVPVALIHVQSAQGELHVHRASSISTQTHCVVSMQAQGQQQNSGYQATTDLAFIERYTLNPQPANIVHPVRSDQMLDPREQYYLGTLLGLDSSSSSQNTH